MNKLTTIDRSIPSKLMKILWKFLAKIKRRLYLIFKPRYFNYKWYLENIPRKYQIYFIRLELFIIDHILFYNKRNEFLKNNKNKYKNKRVFILATGPSLNKTNLNLIKNEYTIGVNGICKISKKINLDFFIYVSNFMHLENINLYNHVYAKHSFIPKKLMNDFNFKNTKYSFLNVFYPRNRGILNHQNPFKPYKFSKDISKKIYAGGTVVYLALQLAYHFGFGEVILLGVDHNYNYKVSNKDKNLYKVDNDNSHFFKGYINKNQDVHVDMHTMEKGYDMANKVFNSNGRKIYNATPNSKLNIFEKRTLESFFNS